MNFRPVRDVVRKEIVRRKLGGVNEGRPLAAPVLRQRDHHRQVACVEGNVQIALVLAPLPNSETRAVRLIRREASRGVIVAFLDSYRSTLDANLADVANANSSNLCVSKEGQTESPTGGSSTKERHFSAR